MLRSIAAAILAVAALAAVAADDAPKPAAPPAAPPVVKGRLPIHYKALGLSDEQKAKIEAVTAKAHAAIADLEQQLSALKAAERADCLAILTDAQRKQLDAILTGADKPVSPAPPKDK